MMCHLVGKTVVGEAYMQEIHKVLKSPLLDTCVTLVAIHLNSNTSDNTCAQNLTSTYLWVYWESPRSPETNLREAFRPSECYNTPRIELEEITCRYQGSWVVQLSAR